jgi:hypothetical protein
MHSFSWAPGEWTGRLVMALSVADVAFVLAAMLLIRLSRYAGMWIYAVVALPGTLAHELAHYLVALMLGAKPSFPSLVPVRSERGWRLGSVAFRVGRLRAMPIALAPVLLAPLAVWWAGALLHPAAWPIYGLQLWIVAALFTASLPSKTDLKLAFPALAALALIGLAIAIVWWMR